MFAITAPYMSVEVMLRRWFILVAAMLRMQLPIVTATTMMATLSALNGHGVPGPGVVAAVSEVAMVAAAMEAAVVMVAMAEEGEEEATEGVMTEGPAVAEAVHHKADDLTTESQCLVCIAAFFC